MFKGKEFLLLRAASWTNIPLNERIVIFAEPRLKTNLTTFLSATILMTNVQD